MLYFNHEGNTVTYYFVLFLSPALSIDECTLTSWTSWFLVSVGIVLKWFLYKTGTHICTIASSAGQCIGAILELEFRDNYLKWL